MPAEIHPQLISPVSQSKRIRRMQYPNRAWRFACRVADTGRWSSTSVSYGA
jgi:hypothetical protein